LVGGEHRRCCWGFQNSVLGSVRGSDFDATHASRQRWNAPITKDNVELLEHLLVCLIGEVGECANVTKKIVRGDVQYDDVRAELASELTDSFIYLAKICNQAGIDLEQEFLRKLDYNKKRFQKYLISH
jgi:NTP pyrophosphatase (non-canonical NTP hydrolase)